MFRMFGFVALLSALTGCTTHYVQAMAPLNDRVLITSLKTTWLLGLPLSTNQTMSSCRAVEPTLLKCDPIGIQFPQ